MRARRFRLHGLPVPGAKSWHVRVPGVYVRSVVADRFGLTVWAREGEMMQGQVQAPPLKATKSKTFWSAGLSAIGFITSVLPFVPPKYQLYADALGKVLAVAAVFFNRQASVKAALAAPNARNEGLR